MSYDLYFTEPPITLPQFKSYFAGRNHYKIENNHAWYENEDTGVYFNFNYRDKSETFAETAESIESPAGNLTFNMNFYRPHFFALEAEPEISNLINHFGLKVHDPQIHGMGEEPYTREGFLLGWNHGNEISYSAILHSDKPPVEINHLPGNALETFWQWNYTKQATQHTVGTEIFVPKIMFVRLEGSLLSAVVWPDGISALVPQVDMFIIPRQKLAPRRLLKRRDDLGITRFKEALPFLAPFKSDGYAVPAFALSYTIVPPVIKAFIKNLKPFSGEMKIVAVDRILNRELIEGIGKG